MDLRNNHKKHLKFTFILFALLLSACSISYKFNGASIDYTKTRTITIKDFNNYAPLVNPTLASQFNDALKDIFTKQTRLRPVSENGDLRIEGEITNYDLTQMSITSNAVAAETRLTITVKVRFTNRANPSKNFEKSFTAFQNFQSSQMFSSVQDELCKSIIDELTETIFNQTVADW
jgi:outer membrane lipopolysaccharide assembly protein LptE/RlpB